MFEDIEQKWYQHKVILVGQSGVGKSCLIYRYIYKTFNQNESVTIGNDFCIKTQEFQGQNIKLKIWDTSGQQTYRSIVDIHFKGCSIVICVFSLDNKKTLQQLKNYWIPHTKNKTSQQDPLFFIYGNKADLIENISDKNNEIQHIVDYLQKNFNCKYIYGSAKDLQDKGIQKMMGIIIQYLYQKIPKEQLKQSRIKVTKRIIDQRKSYRLKSKVFQEDQHKKKRCCI